MPRRTQGFSPPQWIPNSPDRLQGRKKVKRPEAIRFNRSGAAGSTPWSVALSVLSASSSPVGTAPELSESMPKCRIIWRCPPVHCRCGLFHSSWGLIGLLLGPSPGLGGVPSSSVHMRWICVPSKTWEHLERQRLRVKDVMAMMTFTMMRSSSFFPPSHLSSLKTLTQSLMSLPWRKWCYPIIVWL